MILSDRVSGKLSLAGASIILAFAIAVLPGWSLAQQTTDPAAAPDDTPRPTALGQNTAPQFESGLALVDPALAPQDKPVAASNLVVQGYFAQTQAAKPKAAQQLIALEKQLAEAKANVEREVLKLQEMEYAAKAGKKTNEVVLLRQEMAVLKARLAIETLSNKLLRQQMTAKRKSAAAPVASTLYSFTRTKPKAENVTTAKVLGVLVNADGKPIAKQPMSIIGYQQGKRIVFQEGATREDGVFEFQQMPVGQSWQIFIANSDDKVSGAASRRYRYQATPKRKLIVAFDGVQIDVIGAGAEVAATAYAPRAIGQYQAARSYTAPANQAAKKRSTTYPSPNTTAKAPMAAATGYAQAARRYSSLQIAKDPEQQKLQKQLLTLDLAKARSSFELSKHEYDRLKQLADRKVVSNNELAKGKANLAHAEYDLQRAEVYLKMYEQQLAKLEKDLTSAKDLYNDIASTVHAQAKAVKRSKADLERLRERLDVLKQIEELQDAEYRTGTTTLDNVVKAKLDALQAELELADDAKQRNTIRLRLIESAKKLQDMIQAKYEAGQTNKAEVLKARAFRLRVEADQHGDK